MARLQLIKQTAIEDHIPIMRDDTLIYLANLINEHDLSHVLEIGSATGYSSIYLATHTKAHITTIEKDEPRYQIAASNISSMALNNQIKLINEDAMTIQIDCKFDLIVIDAAKTKNQFFFEKFSHLLTEKGFVITDNIGLECCDNKPLTKNRAKLIAKTEEYLVYLNKHELFDTEIIHIGDQIAVSRWK